MNSITLKTAREILNHEGIVRQAYKDSKGIITFGVGVTSASGHNVERYINNPQPMEKVIELFAWLLENKYAPSVEKAFEGVVLSEEQFAAALSFHWNTGSIRRATWVKQFKAGKVKEARKSFMNYKRPKEIIPRRQAERDLFFDGIWSSNGTVTEYTRVKSNMSPDWSSAEKVNIDKALEKAFNIYDVEVDEYNPNTSPTPLKTNVWAILAEIFTKLMKGFRNA